MNGGELTKNAPPYAITAKRAKELFDVGRDMLESWVKQGRVKKYKLAPRKVLYNARQIKALIDAGEVV